MAQTYYDSLQIAPDADQDVIATAYLRLREQHHPRNNPDDALATEIVRYLDSAFAVLMEPERRRAYDDDLRNGHGWVEAAMVDVAPGAALMEAAPAARPPGRVGGFFSRTFASLAIRDYRLLLSGNVITQFGQWFQQIGMNWLVFVVTGSALTMGSLVAWRGIISMVLSPFGGVWADRVDRRTLVILFTIISASEATALAFVVYTGWIIPGSTTLDRLLTGSFLGFLVTAGITKAWVFFLFAFVDGVVNSMANPTRQAFVYDVAGRENVANAIALNASMGNLARATGPNLAGAVIGFFGVHWAFIVRAASIWTALNFTVRIRARPPARERSERQQSTLKALAEGLRYVVHDRLILGLLLAEVILPVLVYHYVQFMPIFATEILHGDARMYGALASGAGIGGIPGGILVASLANYRRKGRLFFLVAAAYLCGVITFTRMTSFPLAMVVLIINGVFLVMTNALVQSLIQLNVRPDVRARTLGLYTMGQSALQPLGTFGLGVTITAIGPQDGVALFALIAVVGMAVVFLLVPQIRRA